MSESSFIEETEEDCENSPPQNVPSKTKVKRGRSKYDAWSEYGFDEIREVDGKTVVVDCNQDDYEPVGKIVGCKCRKCGKKFAKHTSSFMKSHRFFKIFNYFMGNAVSRK